MAILVIELEDTDAEVCARWSSDDLFVPPGFWGTGIGASFLRAVLEALADDYNVTRCVVAPELPTASPWLDESGPLDRVHTDAASRQIHADLVRFYTSLGFSLTLREGKKVLIHATG